MTAAVSFLCSGTVAFIPVVPKLALRNSRQPLFVRNKPKGFGKAPAPDPPEPAAPEQSAAPSPGRSAQRAPDSPSPENIGRKRLDNLRAEAQSKKDEELRALLELRDTDAMLREDTGAAVIPERVAMRMGKRMIPFVGLPLFGGMGLFVAFWYFATYRDVEFQPAIVAASTIALLVVGLLGITYSLMSASWDDDRDGSALGFDELSKNVDSIKSGLGRSRENAKIRDRARLLTDEEIEAARAELKRREEKERRKSLSLEEKLKEELE